VRVSIVTTLYNSAPYVEKFFRRSLAAVRPVADEIEVVFVDDGSPDDAGRRARELTAPGVDVTVVELSRNFGHFQAVMAGLGHADGDLIFLLDVDLEEAPELFAELYAPIAAAAPDDPVDVAFGVARTRKGGALERLGGALFYRLINALSHVEIPVNALMARVMTRRYVQALLTHRERELFLNGVMTITGFRQVAVPVDKSGKDTTTYGHRHRITVALQAITAFSDRPLTIILVGGLALSALAVLFTAYLVFAVLVLDVNYLAGWPSLLAALCFFSGLTLAAIGILGFYLGRVFVEVKARPVIVKAVHGPVRAADADVAWDEPSLEATAPPPAARR
jgi:putative glycosyltransferase